MNHATLFSNCVTLPAPVGVNFAWNRFFLKIISVKKVKWIVIGIALVLTSMLTAQVSININVGTPPPWGPAGYTHVRYYYLPDVEAYYDVRTGIFIYFGGQTWVRRATLPARYSGYDLYRGYKVVMPDYHGNTPYIHYKEHKMKYRKGTYHGKPQPNIGTHPGAKNPGGREAYKGAQEKNKGTQDGHHSPSNEKKGKNNNDKGHDKGRK